MHYYENITILDPSLSDEQVTEALEKITALILNGGGEMLKSDNWGKKDLAYEIHKKKKGFFLFLVFKSPSNVIKKLEDYYKVYDPVFKYMVIKLNKKEVGALMKSMQSDTQEKSETEAAEVV